MIRQRDDSSPCAYLDETEQGFQLRAVHFNRSTASRIECEELRIACLRALQIIEATVSDTELALGAVLDLPERSDGTSR